MVNPDWLPPEHLSPSQIGSLLTCGEQFRLNRVVRVPERPNYGGIGGSAVHRMTEDIDRANWEAEFGEGATTQVHEWEHYWQEALDEAKERNPEFDPEDYYRGGRASKLWPNKEDPSWWAHHGPKFVKAWQMWLLHHEFSIWEYPDHNGELQPGIEVEVEAYFEPEPDRIWGEKPVRVVSIIDRVLVDSDGGLRILDLKSGSMTDAWPRQLILNNLGLVHTHGERATHAAYWKARQGEVPTWHDLSAYSDAWVWQQVVHARTIRDNQLFIAQPNNLCNSACGVREHCVAMGGTPHPLDYDATLTQHQEETQ